MSRTAIAPSPAAGLPARAIAPSCLEGADQSDFVLPRVHIYQGLPTEKKLYPGKFEAGDLVNSLTFERIDKRNFVPICGWKEYIAWNEPRGSGVAYRTRDRSEVPPNDLVWDRQNGVPPRAAEYLNFAVLFEGESTPLVLSFSRTMIQAGKTLNTLESFRGAKGAGFYALETREKSNDKGSWLIPQIRPIGNPPPEMVDLVEAMRSSMAGAKVSAGDPIDE